MKTATKSAKGSTLGYPRILVAPPGPRVDNMIHYRKYPSRIDHRTPSCRQRRKRRRASSLVQKHAVNCDQGIIVRQIGNDMRIPNLGKKSARISQPPSPLSPSPLQSRASRG